MNHQDFINCLKSYRDQIWPLIEKELPSIIKYDSYCQLKDNYHYLAQFHFDMCRVYPERKGKYFRPGMVMLMGEALGASPELLLNTAAAQQLSEEWILIHDDMEDDSKERRGESSLHNIYTKELAVNAGDALHALMWRILQNNKNIIGIDKTFAIMDEFTRMLNRTVLGQTIEIKWTQENKKDLTDDDILLILESKTGYYTVAGPMREGAIIAGATSDQLNKIYQYGKTTGYLFQIKDDLLDLTSDFCGLKKQIGNDIYEGKRTIMLAHLFRTITGSDKIKLDEIMAKDRYHKTPDEVVWVIRKMQEYGSFDHANQLMQQFCSQAQDYFANNMDFVKHQPARSYLEYLPEFLLNRDH